MRVVSDIFTAAGLPDDLLEGLDVIEREQMELHITTDSRRYGKLMTIIGGFDGDKADAKRLLTTLKSKCACGGAIKDGLLELQGEHVKKVQAILQEQGYLVKVA